MKTTRRKELLKRIDTIQATDLQRQVWKALLDIKEGTVIPYKKLAEIVGRPRAIRAVASAVGKNPLAPEVPCHRVVGSGGLLGGYSGKGGIATKKKLLEKEGVNIQNFHT
jgi:methylated-DNA-[protein]-cysteine S-methyltransferase